jgi:hypothetical protein
MQRENDMQMSEQINELAAALSKAQGKITGALKDSENPFFSSKYADLASCWDAAREHLTANGLSVAQGTMSGETVTIEWETTKGGQVTKYSAVTHEIVITSVLMHSSGQWIKSSVALIPRDASPQGIGSCITYGRRYLLSCLIGIAQVDDDGNAASGKSNKDNSGKPDTAPVANDPRILQYAARFRDAMDADETEPVKARMVFNIHTELNKLKDEYKAELYQAVANELPTNYKNAIRAYVKQHQESLK